MEKHISIDADSRVRFSGDRGGWQNEDRRKSPGLCGSRRLQREKPQKCVYLLSLLDKPLSVGAFACKLLENVPTPQTTQMGDSGSWGTHLDSISRRWGSQVSRLRVQHTLLVPLLFPWVEPSLVRGSLDRAVGR